MMMTNFIYGLIFTISGLHPFHVTVTELIYKEDDKAVQIMHKIFVDDFEQTLNKAYGVNLDILALKDTKSIDSLVSDYLSKKFSIAIDGKKEEIVYLGSELEENVLWCYQEIYKVRRPKIFRITNEVMFEEFDDQSNLVHTTLNGELKTLRLQHNEGTAEVSFE
jgi:hypothetical protein